MPTYISLMNWTDQGIRDFKGTVDRAKAAREMAERMGGSLKEIYWTMGEYDLMTISEFPDDETGMAFLLSIGSLGNIRTTTLQAHTEGQISEIISRLG